MGDGKSTIDLNIDGETLRFLIRYMYSGQTSYLNDLADLPTRPVLAIYAGAKLLILSSLAKLSLHNVTKLIAPGTVVAVLKFFQALQQQYGEDEDCKLIFNRCVNFITENYESITGEDISQLEPKIVLKIIKLDDSNISPMHLLKFTEKWLSNQKYCEGGKYESQTDNIPLEELNRSSLKREHPKDDHVPKEEPEVKRKAEELSNNKSSSYRAKQRNQNNNNKPPREIAQGVISPILTESKPLMYSLVVERGEKHLYSVNFLTKTGTDLGMCPTFVKGGKLFYNSGSLYCLPLGLRKDQTRACKVKQENRLRSKKKLHLIKVLEAYDFQSKRWRSIEFQARIDRSGFQVAQIGGNVYIMGGLDPDLHARNEIQCFNLTSVKSVQLIPPMRSRRYMFGVGVFQKYIYAIGGLSTFAGRKKPVTVTLNTMERYDSERKLWKEMATMPTGRRGLAVSIHGHYLYALGGKSSDGKLDDAAPLKTVEVYDLRTNTWSAGVPMIRRRHKFSSVVFEKFIYAVGGDSVLHPTVERFSLESQEWELKGVWPLKEVDDNVAFHLRNSN